MYQFLKKINKSIARLFTSRQIFEKEVWSLRFKKNNKNQYPYKQFNRQLFSFSNASKKNIWLLLFIVLLTLFLFLLPYLSLDMGVSSREWESERIAKQLYESSRNSEKELPQNVALQLQTCGQSMDNLVFKIAHWIGQEDNLFYIRHFVSSLFGFGIFLILGLFLVRLFSWRAALFSLLFLFLSPRFLGNILGNLTDTSFAFFYLLFFYQFFIFTKELPILRIKRLIYITLSIAFATTIYSNGFSLIFYLFLFSILYFLIKNPIKKFFTVKYFYNFTILILLLIAISIVVHITHYLYFASYNIHAFKPPLQPLFTVKHELLLQQQLFNGEIISATTSPLYYTFKYLFITTPFVIFIGFLLFFINSKKVISKVSAFHFFAILVIFIYPFWQLMQTQEVVLQGISQHLFTYPIIILIAVIGIESLLLRIDDKYTNSALISIFIVLLFMPLRYVVLYHPLEFSYFNEISGGIHNVYGKYELDIQQRSNKLAWDSFIELLEKEGKYKKTNNRKIVVYSNGNEALRAFQKEHCHIIDLHFCNYRDRYSYDWDYFISFAHGLPDYEYKYDFWPPDNTTETINVEGKPIVALIRSQYEKIKPNPDFSDDK
jgi:hypothetical protein